MPEGNQKFASEPIFNFNLIFKLKFEFRLWEHLGKLGLVVLVLFLRTKKKSGLLVGGGFSFFYVRPTEGTGPAGTP